MQIASDDLTPLPPLFTDDLAHVLTHTRALWEELRGASLFITGGDGFFGVWLLESFAYANDQLGLGARAVVLSQAPGKFAAKIPHLARRSDLTFVAGDARSFEFPPGFFPFVIHAEAAPDGQVEPGEMFDAIVEGTRRVLEFAATHGTRKFLFVSSGAVYGPQPPDLTHLPEDYPSALDPLDPGSAYGEGKRAAEFLCSAIARKHGFEMKIARGFAFVGPHLPLDAHFAIGNFIRDAMRGDPLHVTGDETICRSYLHAADLAICLWSVLLRGRSHTAYNAGSEHGLLLPEVAAYVAAAFGQPPEVVIAAPAGPGKAAHRYVPRMTRACEDLDFIQRIDLAEAISRTVHWHRQHLPIDATAAPAG